MPQLLKRRPLLGEPAGWGGTVPEFLQRIYAARGVLSPDQAEHRLNRMIRNFCNAFTRRAAY